MINLTKYKVFISLSILLLVINTITTNSSLSFRELVLNYLSNKNLLLKKNQVNIDNSDCLPDFINKIPKDSTAVIGHAYGSHSGSESRGHSGIAPKVDAFLRANRVNLSTVIFTGDVFSEPSISKWNELYSAFSKYFDIYIAPGNHDVGRAKDNAKKDIFKMYVSKKQSINFPFFKSLNGLGFILDDSNNEYIYTKAIQKIAEDIPSNNQIIFLFRHHVSIEELHDHANEIRNFNLFKKKDIEDIFNHKKDVYFIYGDGGAYKNLSRIACFKHRNITHIVNGIGETEDDVVIIINRKGIYQLLLSN